MFGLEIHNKNLVSSEKKIRTIMKPRLPPGPGPRGGRRNDDAWRGPSTSVQSPYRSREEEEESGAIVMRSRFAKFRKRNRLSTSPSSTSASASAESSRKIYAHVQEFLV
jgi:hypothetical protein